jgi:hypothetical protein
MKSDLSHLRPYKSLLLCRVNKSADLDGIIETVLDDVQKLLELKPSGSKRRLAERCDSQDAGELTVGLLHYVEKERAAWTTKPNIIDRVNHLVLVCRRRRQVGIYLSDSRQRTALAKRFDKGQLSGLGALVRVPSGLLNAAFMTGPARTLWLSGMHRRTPVKADSKILSGLELRDALDPLEDQTYFPTAARCVTSIRKKDLTIGVAPRNSRIWAGTSSEWSEFVATVGQLLLHLQKTITPKQAPLPVVAVAESDLTGIRSAFDIGLLPPEALSDDPNMNARTREEMENWAFHTHFEIVKTKGADVKANIFHKGELLGTVEFHINLDDPDRVRSEVEGKSDGASVALQHAKAIEACKHSDWVKIWYESGHTLNGDTIVKVRHRDMPFKNFEWVDFSDYDVAKEKPKPLTKKKIGKDRSLFCWVKNKWPIAGFGSSKGGWLACDDGSMEIADFIHLDDTSRPPKLTLIHAKGAGDNPSRGLSVSYYEVVTSQAVKNLRHLDRLSVEEGLRKGLAPKRGPKKGGEERRKISKLVWRDRKLTTRAKMLAALGSIGTDYERQVIVLQPHVRRETLNEVRAKGKGRDQLILQQLDTLLLGAEASCHGLGAKLTVIGSE